MLISTRAVIDRWKRAIGPARGNIYYVAPGTSAIYVAGRSVTPSNGADGLTVFSPLASVDELITRMTSGRGDVGVLMMEGAYQLTANINTDKDNITIMGAPGLHSRNCYVVGVSGGHAAVFAGREVTLIGFEIDGVSASYAACVLRGRYSKAHKMTFTGSGATPTAGLLLEPEASGEDASFCRIAECEFDYCTTGLLFGFVAGDYPGSTNCRIENNYFRKNSTRDIGQANNSYINGNDIIGNKFFGPINIDFITLNNATNGNNEINTIMDNTFAHNAVTATQIVLTNTTTAFKFVGNRDKAGFITGV